MLAVRSGIHVLCVVWKDQEWLGFDGLEKKNNSPSRGHVRTSYEQAVLQQP